MSRNRAAKLLNNPYAILRRPILTEKSHDMIAPKGAGTEGEDDERKGRYTFDVHVKANKQQIKRAIEAAFGVQVRSINTMIVKPRAKVRCCRAASLSGSSATMCRVTPREAFIEAWPPSPARVRMRDLVVASVAQLVEQGTENPRVGGSIPPRGTSSHAHC